MADEKFSNFLTDIIDADLAEGKVDVVHTRFPPEPNGYLHIGSAKAIFINYTIAKHYGGLFNLRFDDTNPAREGDEYVQSILQDLKWLGAEPNGGIFYGSDYFERCYEYAEQLIKEGKAYVDDLTREEMQEYRGNDAGKPSRPSPYRDRTPEENLDLFERMKNGEFPDGAKVLRMSVSRRAGRWQASLTVERADDPAPKPPKGGSVGIDLGVKELATLSDGTVIRNPHALKSNLTRLRKAQRSLSRKRKGSNRRRKARANVARLHARVANLRRDLLDKTTAMLAHTYADISIEDLNVAGMVKNHGLAQSIQDAAFAEFRRQLTYKTARTGTRLHVIDRWHPSSKTCSNCGTVKTKLSLSERVYHCDKCGLSIDRDLNAAINIQVAGSAPETINARGGSGRQTRPKGGTMRHPAKREPSGGESRVRLGAGLGNEAMQMTSL